MFQEPLQLFFRSNSSWKIHETQRGLYGAILKSWTHQPPRQKEQDVEDVQMLLVAALWANNLPLVLRLLPEEPD